MQTSIEYIDRKRNKESEEKKLKISKDRVWEIRRESEGEEEKTGIRRYVDIKKKREKED